MKKICFNKLSYIACIVVIIQLLNLSCQKDVTDSVPGAAEYNQSEVNLALQELTDIFINATEIDSFRTKLKKETIKEYYHDHEINESELKSGKVENQIVKLFKDYSQVVNIEKVEELVNKIPNYEVSVPVHCDKWNEEDYQPLIAFIPENFNEKIHKKIKAFDNDGNITWLSTEVDPDLPVILIRPKEDIDYSNYSHNDRDNLKSTRVNGANEFIKKIGTDDVSQIEGWFKGPEVELKVVTFSSTGSIISTDFFFPLRREIDETYFTVNHKIDIWNTSSYGNYLSMNWIEEDGGSTTTTSLKYKDDYGYEHTTSYSVKDDDDDLGYKSIHFADYVGQEYNTGKIKWAENNSTYCPYIGSWDGAHCYVGTPPNTSTAFIYGTGFYYTKVASSGGYCPLPGSYYDGANCRYRTIPSGASAFVWHNKWYVHPYNF